MDMFRPLRSLDAENRFASISLKLAVITSAAILAVGTGAATNLNNIESITPAGTNPISINGTLDMNGNPINSFFGSSCPSGDVAVHVNSDGTLDCVDATGEVQGDFVDRSGDTMTGTLDMQGNSIINLDWSDANDLNSGGGISDFSNANDLDSGGNIADFSAANDLNSGGGISDFSNANDLDGNGNVNHGLGATLNDGNSANQNINLGGNNVENLHRIGDPGQNNYIDFTQSSNWLEVQNEAGNREEIVTQDVYVNEHSIWLGQHIGDSNAHHVKTTDTNAATQCSGNDYLAGDGSCNVDSYQANTDNQDLSNVVGQGNSISSGQTIDASAGAFRLPVGTDAY